MARKISEETKRKNTLESLKKALESNKMSEDFLKDKVEEYMSFYDDLIFINKKLIELKNDGNCNIKAYTDTTSEKRRISSEMRNILRFLKLEPTMASLAADGDADEEL